MITVHDDIEQGTDKWLEIRGDRYTGTSAEKLLSAGQQIKIVDGVASAYALNELTNSFGGNFFTRRGHTLEDEAIDLYEQIYGTTVARPGFVTNSKYPTCGYSPDGLDPGLQILLECKAFNPAKHMKIIRDHQAKGVLGVPLTILAQIHFGLTIWELKRARLLLYNPDLEDPKYCLWIIDIKADRNITNNFKRLIAPQPVGI